MELVSSVALGVCLSAACGFRVFVPLLVMGIAGMTGYLTLAESMAWMATWPALILFGTATIVEVVAYYVPWADNALDTIATPAALVAGTIASAAVLGDVSPALQWILAVIAGAGAAGAVQAGTVVARGTSTMSTGGLGNFAVATVENSMSAMTAVLAIVIPLVTLVLIVVLGVVVWRSIRKYRRRLRARVDVEPR